MLCTLFTSVSCMTKQQLTEQWFKITNLCYIYFMQYLRCIAITVKVVETVSTYLLETPGDKYNMETIFSYQAHPSLYQVHLSYQADIFLKHKRKP